MRLERLSEKVGLPPGTMVHVGTEGEKPAQVTVINYNADTYTEKKIQGAEECGDIGSADTVTWVCVNGIHDVDMVTRIGEQFKMHPLLLEDILNTRHRPKLEDYGDHLFIIMKTISVPEDGVKLGYKQVSLVVGEGIVISFQEYQEEAEDIFEPVRSQIRKKRGRIRQMQADYLAYALMDTIVDHYFALPENYGDLLNDLEERLINNPDPETFQQVHEIKREMLHVKNVLWPVREVVNAMDKIDSSLIAETTKLFVRDLYDHVIQVIDAVEALRDMATGMTELYVTSVSNKMNEIMKTLTIIATIFIPLTFVTGIYGMNFHYMPELTWRYGYFYTLGFLFIAGTFLAVYFKKKRWF